MKNITGILNYLDTIWKALCEFVKLFQKSTKNDQSINITVLQKVSPYESSTWFFLKIDRQNKRIPQTSTLIHLHSS